jgi:muramoyltetrapeptide carboxypeptidase
VVAPSGPVTDACQLAAGIARLTAWGLQVVPGPHLTDRHPRLPYLAGDDRDRAADLQRAWCDPDIAAVLCARGGYGCLRTLQHLDLDAMAAASAARPVVFAGSSDVTALHAVLGPRLGLVTLFAPMVATAAFGVPANYEHLRRTLFEPETVTVLAGPAAEPLVAGRASGVTAGGNLSLLVSGLGVPGVPLPPDGAIALVEDVDEAPYRVDHFLTHLLRAGWFDRVAGVALGSWHSCGPLPEVRDVVADRLAPLGVPVVWELGFGHGVHQLTVPLGVPADLDATAGTLTLHHPALV